MDRLKHRWQVRQTMFLDQWLRWLRAELLHVETEAGVAGLVVIAIRSFCPLSFHNQFVSY